MTSRDHQNKASDADVQRLMELAPRRLEPPQEARERVQEAFMEAFAELPQTSSSNRRHFRALAIAASVAAALVIGYGLLTRSSEQLPLGEIEFASGSYSVLPEAADGSSAISAGGTLQTAGDGRIFLVLDEALSVRLDGDTRITLDSASKLRLHRGRIYLDSSGARFVEIHTRHGTITNLGTLFEVASGGAELTVAVREGSVEVNLGQASVRSEASPGQGEILHFSAGKLHERRTVASTDARWGWIGQARPGFRLADSSVAEFLTWAAREGGRTLVFDSNVVRQQAQLPGAFQGAAQVGSDLRSIEQVLRTTRFALVPAEPHVLRVAFRPRQS